MQLYSSNKKNIASWGSSEVEEKSAFRRFWRPERLRRPFLRVQFHFTLTVFRRVDTYSASGEDKSARDRCQLLSSVTLLELI